jgi:hypothetical protein
VNAGDRITYRADGTIQMVTGADDRATHNGSITGRRAANAATEESAGRCPADAHQ